MKVQIVSDLHLEFRGKDVSSLLIPSAPILCMVGDICVCGASNEFKKFLNFLTYYTPKFEAIIHVAGNHEYYTSSNSTPKDLLNNTMPKIDKQLQLLNKQFSNYHYLNNSIWTYQCIKTKRKYIFVGTTLWTHIPSKKVIIDKKKNISIDLPQLIQKKMNDYNYIYVPHKTVSNDMTYRKYTVSDMQKKHNSAIIFLKRTIQKIKEIYHKAMTNKIQPPVFILLTHHKPLFDRATDEQDEFTYAYENNLASTLLVPPFSLAAHGHTHKHYDKRINGVRVVSNPKGYIGENTSYNNKFVVNI
jgi:predicted phosphodiesterase